MISESDDIHLSEEGIRSFVADCIDVASDLVVEGRLNESDASTLAYWADVIRRCDYEHGLIPEELERAYSSYIHGDADGYAGTRGHI